VINPLCWILYGCVGTVSTKNTKTMERMGQNEGLCFYALLTVEKQKQEKVEYNP
jgi:hypothetical protein